MDSMNKYLLDIDENDHARNILNKLNSRRQERSHCDFIIRAEGREIHVNRDVMCAASDYFHAMFSHDTKEKEEGVVEMKGVKFSAIKKCVDFIYSGKISVSEDECEELLYSASLMQLNQVCDKISQFLECRLTLKSFFNIKRIAFKFSIEMLNRVSDEFALAKLFELSEEKQFNSLEMEYVHFLLSSKKSLRRRSEDCKLSIALQWVKADLDTREEHLMNIVDCLDSSKLTSGYAMYLLRNEPLCIRFPELMRELSSRAAHSHHVKITGPPNASDILSTAGITSPNSMVIFEKASKLIHLYQPSENILTCVNAYNSEMDKFFCASVQDEYLYVFNRNRKVFRLNISEKNLTWTQIPDMLHNHGFDIQCAVHKNFIYVGGHWRMERYQVGGNGNWEDIDLDGNICVYSALIEYEDCIFVIGGYSHGSVNSVRKFSPSSSTWTSVKSMNVARAHPSATVFNSKIYVAGGEQDCNRKLSDFEMYDGVSDSWTILPKMILPRVHFCLCSVDNHIFAIGNWELCSIEVYDLKNAKWIFHHGGPEMAIWAPATVTPSIAVE